MTTTNKGGGSIPGSKNRFAWQTRKNCYASRQRYRSYPGFYPCTRQVQQSRQSVLKDRPTWALNSYWVVQCYRGPRARHNWLAHLSYIFNCRVVVPNRRAYNGLRYKSTSRGINGVGLLLIWQLSKVTHIRVESWVCLHSLDSFLNKEVHRHRAVKRILSHVNFLDSKEVCVKLDNRLSEKIASSICFSDRNFW